jgi:tryptophan 2,3-dioxygenase
MECTESEGGSPVPRIPYELYISLGEVEAAWGAGSDWANESILRPGLCALELTFLLIRQASQDPRSMANQQKRVNRLLDLGRRQLDLLDLLLDDSPLPAAIAHGMPSQQTSLAALQAGPPAAAGTKRAWTRWGQAYGLLAERLPYRLGLGPADPAALYVPYDAWVEPDRLEALFRRRDFNQEDPLFATVHQIVECWLAIALRDLEGARSRAGEERWSEATGLIERVSAIFGFVTEQIQILDLMVLADYHPLRVALRGASGAQSRRVALLTQTAAGLPAPVEAMLARTGGTLLDIYRYPERHPGPYAYLESLSDLEKGLSGFYFCHYKLTSKVLGLSGTGTGGYEVRKLAARFVAPFYPVLDQARFDHTMVTNLRHGCVAGSIIQELERADGRHFDDAPGAPIAAEQVGHVVEQYLRAIEAANVEAWVALFDEQGSIEDPAGSRPFVGHVELRVFFSGVFQAFRRLRLQAADVQVQPDGEVQVAWDAEAEAYNGRPVQFSGVELFAFTPTGKIRRARVINDPEVIAEQIHPHLYRVMAPGSPGLRSGLP